MSTNKRSCMIDASCSSNDMPSSDGGCSESGSEENSGGIDMREANGALVGGIRDAVGCQTASARREPWSTSRDNAHLKSLQPAREAPVSSGSPSAARCWRHLHGQASAQQSLRAWWW